jgi:hypothetical protein
VEKNNGRRLREVVVLQLTFGMVFSEDRPHIRTGKTILHKIDDILFPNATLHERLE